MFLANALRRMLPRVARRRRGPCRLHKRLVVEALEDRCLLSGVVRSDYFLDTISTLPHYYGLPAQLDIHEVAPVYSPGQEHRPTQAAILVHGRTIDAVTGFDLQYQDYSLQESMARAGINTFAVNFLGWGLSTHFGLDDARNASLSDQQTYLIPNPLDHTYDNPDPFHFTNTSALVNQLDAVVNDVRDRLGVQQVSLFAWSRGGLVVGPYSYLHPEKVKNLILLSSAYNFAADPPDPLPQPGPSLEIRDRAFLEADWTRQVDNVAFPGQQDPAILDPIWQSLMARDPLGSTWGTNGLNRFPSADYWGWNPQQHQASLVTVPTLVLQGQLDATLPAGPATGVQLYNDLGSEKKVLIKVDGGSHLMPWEGSTSPTWRGPHATLQDAAVQWITSETYQGATSGTFEVHADGSIEEGPAKVASVVVNDGSAQRSMVNSLTVTFSTVVHLDPGAFELVRQEGGVIQFNVSQAVLDGHSVDTLTFSGAGIIGGSLADGHYTLTIHGNLVHDDFAQALDGDHTDTFFRLFGDSDGDGHVGLQDLLRLGSTLGKHAGDPGYLWYFDYDGRVDFGDLLQLLRRLGQ
jgi:pimeloyl-ACP methyl ester carboxylesterase